MPDLAPTVAHREQAPASRLGLSRARVIDGALALLDREGLDAFSMRRLAEELGVGTMTIYGYFRSKDELLDAIVGGRSEAIGDRLGDGKGAGSWKQQMRKLMTDIRQGLIEHPAIVELRYRRPLLSPGALTVTETGMRILREAGFSKRDAARIYRLLFVYTFGYSAFGPGPGSALEREESLRSLRALPPDRYPNLTESIEEASDAMADQTLYELGLDALLDGLERELRGGQNRKGGGGTSPLG